MKILIASDHAGFELKGKLFAMLKGMEIDVEDMGASVLDPKDDFPDFVANVGRRVSADSENVKGIVIGGSGQGEAISANRFPHVRAAVFYGGPEEIVRLSREHNDANVLSLGARFMDFEQAKHAVELWIATPFSNDERHVRRIAKIETEPSATHFND